MKISELISRDLICVNLKSHTKENAFSEIVDHLYKSRKIKNKQQIQESLIEREKLVSTGIGDEVAIPHARIADLKEPVVFIGISKNGINFSSIDNKPVHLIILFLTPQLESQLHLKILSKIAHLLKHKELIDHLKQCSTNEELFSILKQGEMDKEGFLALSKEEIYLELASSDNGISEESAKERLEVYGLNKLKGIKKISFVKRFLSHFTNLLALLMLASSALCFLTQMPEAGYACIAVIIINAIFGFWQEFKAEKSIEALAKLMPSNARVIRGEKELQVPTDELVPGDIIIVEEGDNIPADARLIESQELRVNNSAFSGESKLSHKISEGFQNSGDFLWIELPNLIFAGTSVAAGMGKAVVIATGMGTEIGKIAYLTQVVEEELSPLQKEVNKICKLITVVSLVIGLVFFCIGLIFTKMSSLASAMFAVGIMVANVPQGLMPTLTLSLAMAVQRMAKRKALIKKLSSVETLGCTNVICTDKTGTLTTNQMSVCRIWINGKIIEVSGNGYEPIGTFSYQGRGVGFEEFKNDNLKNLIDTGVLCNTAKLVPPSETQNYWNILGDPTEGALLVLAQKAGFNVEEERNKCITIKRFPFESVRKRMSSIHKFSDERVSVYVKGAPKELLDISTKIIFGEKVIELTQTKKAEIMEQIDNFAKEGLRVLGFAYRGLQANELSEATANTIERDLIFVGITAMYDPPRIEVPDAVAVCRKAGIRIVMITGDYQLTALSIAKQVGIVSSNDAEVISGAELTDLTEEQLKDKLVNKEVIFARVNPEQKLRVVNAFKELGNIVAVTGDGVNDAPALRRADIGVAMGLRGTDVARESAEMVLIDDNFASIVYAIEEGRAVFDNIKKFLTYIFAHLVPEGIPFIFFVLFKIPVPITVMQILAIDLGTEILPSLALGAEKPEPGIMNLPPRPKKKGVIDKIVLFRGYLFLGLLNSAAVLIAYYFVLFQGGWKPGMQLEPNDTTFTDPLHLKAMTVVFVGIIVMQIANIFNCRSEKYSVFKLGFFSNGRIFLGIAVSLIFTMCIVYLPFFQKIFNTTAIGWKEWGILVVFMIFIFIFEELRKKIFYRKQI